MSEIVSKTFVLTFKQDGRSQKRTVAGKDWLDAIMAFWETRQPNEGLPVVTQINGASTKDPSDDSVEKRA